MPIYKDQDVTMLDNPLPQAGIILDDPSGSVYVFAPASKHSNTLVVNVTNPTMANIQNGPNARIVITFSTSDAEDPNALTSAALAQKILAKVSAFDENWTYDHQQQGALHTVVLKPQGPTIVGYGDHALISIVLSDLVTDLPDGRVTLHVAVRDFPGLDDAQATLVLHRSAYPAPQAELWPVHPGVRQPGQPLLIGWNVQFADTLTLTFDDERNPPTSYSLANDEIALSEAVFKMVDAAFFSGRLVLTAGNDSHPDATRTIVQDVNVLPLTEVAFGFRGQGSSGNVTECNAYTTPAPTIRPLTKSLTCIISQENPYVQRVTVALVGSLAPNQVPDQVLFLRVFYTPGQDIGFMIVTPDDRLHFNVVMVPDRPVVQQTGCYTGPTGVSVPWSLKFQVEGQNFSFWFEESLSLL